MGFSIIPQEVIDNQDKIQNPHSMVVLMVLASFINKNGHFFPTMKTLAEKACISPRKTKDAIKFFLKEGWIEKFRDPNGVIKQDMFKWGPQIDMSSNSIWAKMGVSSNVMLSNDNMSSNSTPAVKQHENVSSNVQNGSENAVKQQHKEFKEEEIKDSSSLKTLNTCSQTSEDMLSNVTSFEDQYPIHIAETMNDFSGTPENEIIEFFKRKLRITENHEPMTQERLQEVTSEALVACREFPNEQTPFVGAGIWKYFKEVWERVRYGETRFHIWCWTHIEVDAYWQRKNYVPPTDEEMKVLREKDLKRRKKEKLEIFYLKVKNLFEAKERIEKQEAEILKLQTAYDHFQKTANIEPTRVHQKFHDKLKELERQYFELEKTIFLTESLDKESLDKRIPEYLAWKKVKDAEMAKHKARMGQFKNAL